MKADVTYVYRREGVSILLERNFKIVNLRVYIGAATFTSLLLCGDRERLEVERGR